MRRELLPYQVTRRGVLAVTIAFAISFCLYWYGTQSPWGAWACLAGASFEGGALGAVIGHVFRDERGGAASLGAYFGALAGPVILVILFFAVVLADGAMSV